MGTRSRATEVLQLIHGNLARPMPVESIGRRKYAFVLRDDYSRAGWMHPLRDKSDAPVVFERWASLITNGTDRTIKTVMFDNAKGPVAVVICHLVKLPWRCGAVFFAEDGAGSEGRYSWCCWPLNYKR